MSNVKLVKNIFEKWSADLRTKDRGWSKVSANFDELFYELTTNSVPFDEAHAIIDQAIKSHLPNNAVARKTYDASDRKGVSFQEWVEEWKKGISDFAKSAFYTYYRADGESPEKEEEQKKFGNMSEKEYRLQRAYAESFPVFDTRHLQQKMKEGKLETLDDYLEALGFDPESTDGNDE